MHTPVEVTERALENIGGADGLVSLGGGSAIGLGKALALRMGVPHIAIPTTYSGSEISPILGQTREGKKTTIRDKRVVPQAVIYDVALTLSLPLDVTASSGFNAMAHAFEALYALDRSPETDRIAVDAIEGFARALPTLVTTPKDEEARAAVLYAAYLSGRVLAARTMGLHHKLAHVLGGLYDLPHAPCMRRCFRMSSGSTKLPRGNSSRRQPGHSAMTVRPKGWRYSQPNSARQDTLLPWACRATG